MNQKPTVEAAPWKCDEETGPTFKIAMVYDDLKAGIRAMEFVSGVIRQFSDEFEFQCGLWRFDVLELPAVQETAVWSGGAADLLIVSARGDKALPASVEDWIEASVAQKAPGSAALVGLLVSRHAFAHGKGLARQFLQSAANRGQIDFFQQEVELPRTSPSLTPEDLLARANPVSNLLEGILPEGESTPRWGTPQ